MFAFALTRENRNFVKQALRSALPFVRSSHLTESLAAALGYRTHAALLSDIAKKARRRQVIRFDDVAFANRLYELNSLEIQPTLLSGILRSPALPFPVWREFQGTRVRALNSWFYECKRRGLPYIYVTTARKYATLEWDCISIDPSYDEGIKGSDVVVRKLFETCRRVAISKKWQFEGSSFVGQVKGLCFDEARDLADQFSLLIDDAIAGVFGTKVDTTSDSPTRKSVTESVRQ